MLSAGLIMHDVGNDSKILQKIKEGLNKGLIELDVHGWDHIDYTTLGEREQLASLSRVIEKMQELFGKNSSIFIPPLSVFNSNTLKALSTLKLNILSSDYQPKQNLTKIKAFLLVRMATLMFYLITL